MLNECITSHLYLAEQILYSFKLTVQKERLLNAIVNKNIDIIKRYAFNMLLAFNATKLNLDKTNHRN